MTEKNKTNFFIRLQVWFESYKYLVQLIHGVLLTLAFHPFDIFIVIPVALSGFIFCLERECLISSKNNLFKIGFKHGFTFFFGHFITSLYWIIIPLFTDIKQYWFLVPLGLFGVPALLAVFYAIFSGFISSIMFKKVRNIGRKRVIIAVAFSFAFFIAEILRSHLIIPFPWNLLGYATGYSLSLMQFASVVGVYGLSLLLYFIGTIPYTRHPIAISIVTLTIFIITMHGRDRLNKMEENTNKTTTASLHIFQTNFDSTQMIHDSRKAELKHIDDIINAARNSKSQDNLQLLILPETGLPLSISTHAEHILQQTMSKHHKNTLLITGIDRYNNVSNEHFNSMIVVNNTGEIIDSYDKLTLAPFGEYIPGLSLIQSIVGKNHGFTPGKRVRNFRVYNKYSYDALVIKPTICFESIFSPITDTSNVTDIDLILNLTNDSWLGNSIGPYQHLAMARMRSIEYGVPLARVAKTGISAVFNSHGRLMRSLPLQKEAIMIVDMPLDKVSTIYMQIIKAIRN
jgi:apolipoprotein N-acyltransferase